MILLSSLAVVHASYAQGNSRRVIELESHSAQDLSLSLLRDNYDVWAEEMIQKNSVELARRLSDQEILLDELTQREAEMSQQLKKKLYTLAFAATNDVTALKAALFISSRASGRERRDALQRATLLAQQLAPGSEQALEVAVMFTAELLASGDLPQASRMSAKIVTMASQARLVSTAPACMAKVVAGDVSFQEREFSNARDLYKLASECFASRSGVVAPPGLHLELRAAWAAFRLTRYAEVLSHLEKMARDPSSDKFLNNTLVSADLSMMLGVSLSEVDVPIPASHWQRSVVHLPWVASGLAKSIRYLSQKDSDSIALRWVDVLEVVLAGTPAAEDFYVSAVEVTEKSGLLERQVDLKERGVLALQIGSHYARSVSKDLRRDQLRMSRVVAWSKDVIAYRAAQTSGKMSSAKALQFFRVADVLTRENVDVCSFSDTLRVAHRTLSSAQNVTFSEKIYSVLSECRLSKSAMEEVRAARLEMYQLVWKANTRESGAWQRYRDEVFDTLAFSSAFPETRRIALDALNDSIEFGFLVDSEDLLSRLYASHVSNGEGSHFERESFIAAVIRLLSIQVARSSLENLSWLIHRDVASTLGVTDSSRRLLEGSLAAYIVARAGALKQEGRLLSAADRLLDAGDKMGRDSEFARDLVFFSVKSYCAAGFQEKCIEVAKSIVTSAAHAEHDKFYALRWLGVVYAAQGRFVAAANVWTSAAELARDSGRAELLALSVEDLSRAGSIFAELKLWQETLRVKGLLMEMSNDNGQISTAYRSVLDWSVLALREEAFDHAERLSNGLFAVALERKKQMSSRSSKLVGFAGVVEEYAKIRARKLPAAGIEGRLLSFISDRKIPLTHQSIHGVLPVGSVGVVQSAFSYWRAELEREAETAGVGRSVGELRDGSERLGKLFVSLMKGCAVLEQQPQFSSVGSKKCSQQLSMQFVGYNARIMASLAGIVGVSASEANVLYQKVQRQTDEFRRGASLVRRDVLVKREPGFAVLEASNFPSNEREMSR
jgi:hypothetical protein